MYLPTAREGYIFKSVCPQGGWGSASKGEGGLPNLPGTDILAATAVVGTHPTGMHSVQLQFVS